MGSIQPAAILHDLDELWASLGKDEGEAGVLRACAMTLVVLTSEPADDPVLGETLAALVERHPSRTIVIRLLEGDGRVLEAGVSAQCWMPFGHGQQICSEQIRITSSRAGLADLPPVLRGLAAPDLPVVVWLRGELSDSLSPLLALADKVVVNSTGASDAAARVTQVRSLATGRRTVADLSYTRLTRWRETIAQVFADPGRRSRLDAIRDVRISHYCETVPVRALYLSAWVGHVLGESRQYMFVPAGREPCQRNGEVQSLELIGDGIDVSIAQLEGEAVEVRVDGLTTRRVFRTVDEQDLLREELAISGPDPVFDSVLSRAAGQGC